MRRSVGLRVEPNVRQTEAILGRVERVLGTLGAHMAREGHVLRFRMPAPWRAPHLGILLAITSGVTRVSAGAGERRQLRYELHFTGLRIAALAITLAVAVLGWGWPRATLIVTLLGTWGFLYGLPRLLAGRRFHRLVSTSAREIVERRRHSRPTPAAVQTSTPVEERAAFREGREGEEGAGPKPGEG